MEIETTRKFTLKKEEWDAVSLMNLSVASDVTNKADLGAVTLQEGHYTFSSFFSRTSMSNRVGPRLFDNK